MLCKSLGFPPDFASFFFLLLFHIVCPFPSAWHALFTQSLPCNFACTHIRFCCFLYVFFFCCFYIRSIFHLNMDMESSSPSTCTPKTWSIFKTIFQLEKVYFIWPAGMGIPHIVSEISPNANVYENIIITTDSIGCFAIWQKIAKRLSCEIGEAYDRKSKLISQNAFKVLR